MNWIFDNLTNFWGLCAQFLPLSPLVLRIRITNRCNLSCHYCYVGESLNQKKDYPLQINEWKKILNSLSRFTLIDITGGEPLLAPNFMEVLDLMLERKHQVSLISNGTIFKEDVFQLMVNKKLKHFMISVDGAEDIHDSVRGKGSFNKVIKTASFINHLKKESGSTYPKLVAKVTVTTANIHSLSHICQELIKVHGFDGITLNLLFQNKSRDGFASENSMNSSKFHEGNLSQFTPEQAKLLAEGIRFNKRLLKEKIQIRPDIDLNNLEQYFSQPHSLRPVNCHKFNSVVTLYHDGVLTPCDLGLDIGNIRELDYRISEVFKMKTMDQFLSYMRKETSQKLPGCEGCCLKKHESIS